MVELRLWKLQRADKNCMSEQDISKHRYAMLLLFTHLCSQKNPGLYVTAHSVPTSHQVAVVGSDAQASAEGWVYILGIKQVQWNTC